jgi:hypothetical protein
VCRFNRTASYSQWKEDKEALKQAIQSAISTPFEPFIRESFRA